MRLPKYRLGAILSTPAPVATNNPTADWKTYTNNEMEFSINYPSNFTVNEDGLYTVNIREKSEGQVVRWVNIYTTSDSLGSTDSVLRLYELPVGGKSLTMGGDERQKEFETVVRLADKKIGGVVWHIYDNNNPWESPKPLRYFILFYNNKFYIIEVPYSDSTGFSKSFDQILSTFKFTN